MASKKVHVTARAKCGRTKPEDFCVRSRVNGATCESLSSLDRLVNQRKTTRDFHLRFRISPTSRGDGDSDGGFSVHVWRGALVGKKVPFNFTASVNHEKPTGTGNQARRSPVKCRAHSGGPTPSLSLLVTLIHLVSGVFRYVRFSFTKSSFFGRKLGVCWKSRGSLATKLSFSTPINFD